MQRIQAFSRLVACRNAPLLWHRFNSTQPIRLAPRAPRNEAEARIGSDTGPNSVRVKFKFSPLGTEDVLATVKYIESLYGPIDEFICNAIGERKAWYLFVRFRDYTSASQAAKQSQLHHRMPAPPKPNEDPSNGGVSLETLQKYLGVNEQANLEPDLVEEPDLRYDRHAAREFLYFAIDKAYDIRSAPSPKPSSFLSPQATRNFVNWAGFAPIKPLPADTPLLEQRGAVDYPVMRHIVRKYAEMRSMVNPLESSSQERQWVADTDRIPSSSTTKASEKLAEKVVENKEKLSRVAATPPTLAPTPVPVVVKPPPASPPPKATSPPPSPNSPEAIAQLRAANSVLKKLTSKPKAKAKGQGPTQQSRSQSNIPTPKLKQGGKVATAPTLNKSAQKARGGVAKGSTPPLSQNATSSSAQSKDKAKPVAQSVSGRLQRFMGKFF